MFFLCIYIKENFQNKNGTWWDLKIEKKEKLGQIAEDEEEGGADVKKA